MSGDVVIRAEGLGKRYIIGHQADRQSYQALRDVLARNARTLARSAVDIVKGRPNIVGDTLEEFWALKGVDFEIRSGEVVGVIGRNGAGKSTLLKVLSRITEPTEGRVSIRGRVASLLEVGTGFHPELTGRENIYLNGAILGMTQAEIRRKFDEIVAFAEVDRFLDTPVKRYSSGMYVRLAFAVAAHLEPEILIIDEVLAVGDAEFQKKCLGKMDEVASHGRTVLFVSHNMSAVEALCKRGIVLSSGGVVFDGPPDQAVSFYAAQQRTAMTRTHRIGADLEITRARTLPAVLEVNQRLDIELDFVALRSERIMELSVMICALDGTRIGIVDARECGLAPVNVDAGAFRLVVSIPRLPLVEGEYAIALHMRTRREEVEIPDLADLHVVRSQPAGDFVPVAPAWRGVIELSAQDPQMRLETRLPHDAAGPDMRP